MRVFLLKFWPTGVGQGGAFGAAHWVSVGIVRPTHTKVNHNAIPGLIPSPGCVMSLLELLHLVEAELERRLALEDGDEDLELLGLGHDLGDRGRHGLERSVGDGDDLADLELGLDDLDGCG